MQVEEVTKLSVRLTEKAHDKVCGIYGTCHCNEKLKWKTYLGIISMSLILQDINSIAVSPNDKLIATGSQDKTAKVMMK